MIATRLILCISIVSSIADNNFFNTPITDPYDVAQLPVEYDVASYARPDTRTIDQLALDAPYSDLPRHSHCQGHLRSIVHFTHVRNYGKWVNIPRLSVRDSRYLTVRAIGTCCFKVYRNSYFRGGHTLISPGSPALSFIRLRSIRVTSCPTHRRSSLRRTRRAVTAPETTFPVLPNATKIPTPKCEAELFAPVYRPTARPSYKVFDEEFGKVNFTKDFPLPVYPYDLSFEPTQEQADYEDNAMDEAEINNIERPIHCNGNLTTVVPFSHSRSYGSWTHAPRIPKIHSMNILASAVGNCCFKLFPHINFVGRPVEILPNTGVTDIAQVRSIKVAECLVPESPMKLLADDPAHSRYVPTVEPPLRRATYNLAEVHPNKRRLTIWTRTSNKINDPIK